MKLEFDPALGAGFTSWSQRARVLTEGWVATNAFCPACGASTLAPFPANRPVADFHCRACHEQFELKSQRGALGKKIIDGAYRSMINRISSAENPNFFVLCYDRERLLVTDLDVIPKHFFTPDVIERRTPLGVGARRAGWEGCTILMNNIPRAGRIPLVKAGVAVPVANVLIAWHRTLFLRTKVSSAAKGWLLDVMRLIDRLGKTEFTLAELYACQQQLEAIYPNNRNVLPKIRQQLQRLRDAEYLDFLGSGVYRLR